jgi:hypothetical protein
MPLSKKLDEYRIAEMLCGKEGRILVWRNPTVASLAGSYSTEFNAACIKATYFH